MSLLSAARRLAKILAATNHKIVFAESCTAGLVSQSLSRIPGISAWHCGGMVTYRNETKQAYLGISPKILKDPGPVSEEVAELMAERVLAKTPEATFAASVTGHLGPNAPRTLDGLVFLGLSYYENAQKTDSTQSTVIIRYLLPKDLDRSARQKLAAEALLQKAAEHMGDWSMIYLPRGLRQLSDITRPT